MHDFSYKKGKLCVEDVTVSALVREFGTPLYVYSYATLLGHFLKLQQAFAAVSPLICYSVKANSNLGILNALVEKGAGLDIVSGGELYRALKAGCPASRIVYASVGKTDAEIEEAIRRGILFFNVESLPELEHINRIAGRLGKVTRAALRINPDVEAKTHKYITTGKLTNKFGIDLERAGRILRAQRDFAHVQVCGIHIHIGSQITQSAPFVAALTKVSRFIEDLVRAGVRLEYLNIGGGLGIVYRDEKPQTAVVYASRIVPLLKKTGLKIIMEPGRFIVGNAGILVTRVLYVKHTPKKKFIIVDGGMNDLIRPALYEAYHEILPVEASLQRRREKADIVGPICESGDYFAKERRVARVREGDLLAVMSAGAYGFSMSSNYNSRRRAAEVMVKGKRCFLLRERESFGDLIRNERIPKVG